MSIKSIAATTGITIGILSSLPWWSLDSGGSDSFSDIFGIIMYVFAFGGLIALIFSRQRVSTKFAGIMTGFGCLAYVVSLLLTQVFIATEYSQWSTFALFSLPWTAGIFFLTGILVSFILRDRLAQITALSAKPAIQPYYSPEMPTAEADPSRSPLQDQTTNTVPTENTPPPPLS